MLFEASIDPYSALVTNAAARLVVAREGAHDFAAAPLAKPPRRFADLVVLLPRNESRVDAVDGADVQSAAFARRALGWQVGPG